MQQDAPLTLLSTFDQFFPQQTPQLTLQPPGYAAWIATSITDDSRFSLACAEKGGRAVFTWQTARLGKALGNRPLPPWAQLPAGVIVRLASDGLDLSGFSAAIASREQDTGPRFMFSLGAAVAAMIYTLHERDYTQASIVALLDSIQRTLNNA